MSDETTRMYSNGEVVVVWEEAKCKHSGICARGLPKVFNTKKKPWIQLEHATTEQIIAQVKQCPSGALSLEDLTQAKNEAQDEGEQDPDPTPPS